MKKLSFVITYEIFAILLSVVFCYGQQKPHSIGYWITVGDQLDSSIATLHLDTLQGKILTLYGNGYKVRAKAIYSMVEKCAAFYELKFPDVKFNLEIMILNQLEWDKINLPKYGSTYGMPTAWSRINKIFIAADKKTVGKLLGGNDDNTSDSILSAYDVLALHELGHIFLETYKHTFTQKKWADEFLATYFKTCFLKINKGYPHFPGTKKSSYQPKYRTLEDFEQLYTSVGPRNYSWYQGKFGSLGKRLYPKFKTKLIKIFIANYSADGQKIPPLALLKQLAPGITNQWLSEMK